MPWLLLTYSVPREPSASRVYVWRKLKKLGAVAMQDAAWVLPATPMTKEQLRWLAAEIKEMGGEALLWEAQGLLPGQEERLVEQFEVPVRQAYQAILNQLKVRNADMAELSRTYQQTLAQDYFSSKLGQQVRAALLKAKGGKRP